MNEQLEFIKEIAARLDSAEIRYMLTGSMALALYSRPRMTRDIDLVIECRALDSESFVKLFKDLDWIYMEQWAENLEVKELLSGMKEQ